MKSAHTIQLAHDMLVAAIDREGEDSPFASNEAKLGARAAADVLCWILGHENQTFGKNLEAVDAWFTSRGLALKEVRDLARMVH